MSALRLSGWLMATALTTGCLPNTLTDAEVADRIAAAKADSVSGVDTGAPVCGNNVLESQESCDDGNGLTCDGCENCQLRRVFDVKEEHQFALAQSDAFNFLTNGALANKDQQVSLSIWLRAQELPPGNKGAVVALLATEKYDPVLAIGIGSNAGNGYAYCYVKGVNGDKPLTSPTVLHAQEWHHLRCTITVDKAKPAAQFHAYLSVDGASPADATGLAPLVAQKTPLLGVGSLPALDQAVPFRGQVDELHITTGTESKLRRLVQRRVTTAEAGVALYHMDLRDHDKALHDTGPNQAHAQQWTWGVGSGGAELIGASDDCYGFAAGGGQCGGASTQPPWCQ